MFPEKSNLDNLDNTQDNDFKRAIAKVFKEFKENINKCWNEDQENINKNRIQ